jgi:hypothetical protein
MPFYHASRNVYPDGHVIHVPKGEVADAYQLSLRLGAKWREDALEATRAGRAFSRQFAVYAANSPGNAARFLISQPDAEKRPVLVYEVDINNKSPSPMVLIGYMDDQGEGFAALPECMEEYWAPTRNWRFLEYVCSEMIVTKSLGPVGMMETWGADADYGRDRDLCRQAWGQPPKKVQPH